MVVAQRVKEAEVTELDSLLLTKNLLRIAIFNISYIRGLFPEKYFNDKAVPALDMKIKKLMPVDAESRRLIDWMEKGVHDALQKKYLKTLLFCVCEATAGPVIEEYAFSFSYPNPDGQEVSMDVSRSGSKKGGTFQQISSSQMRSSACKMIRTLVQLMRTLDKMPEERSIVMKLMYYDTTPADYEPPFFRGCTEEEAHNPWTKNPLKMEVGNVNSKHVILTLKVKSVLDPCEDENDNNDNTSLDGHSADGDSDSDSDSGTEITMPDEDQYIVAPADEQQNPDNSPVVDEDDTQDPEADEQRLTSVRDWIKSCHLQTINFTDVLSHFPDISVVISEEILEKLATEGVVSKSGEDSYCINKEKDDYEFVAVKEESAAPPKGKYMKGEDHMYMKALYHALPMDYITVAKLQSKLDDAKATTVRKLIDKMAQEGFVESKSLRRLGRRVIHSDLTNKKLMEVQKTLNMDAMDVDVNANGTESEPNENSHKDLSTCGAVRSIGSDLTRTGRSSRSELSKRVENGNSTPMSMAKPTASRESCAAGPENGRTEQCDQQDTVMCSNPSQGRFRKTSMVRDPILQFMKRQRIEAV